MQTLMKTTLAAALSIAAFSPAIAGDKQPIVVQSEAAMQEWQGDVTRTLNRRLVSLANLTRTNTVNGIAQIRFTLDEDGMPQDIEVYSSTGDGRTDRVAKRAVRGLTRLDEAPVTDAAQRTFQANIIFADSVERHEKLAEKLAMSETARLAKAEGEGSVISFGL